MKLTIELFIFMMIFLVVWLYVGKHKQLWKNVSNKIERVQDHNIILVIVLFSIVLEGSVIFSRQLPFVADEVYSISGAAYFAGYDWSDYMSLHKFYNFGYTMLFAPLYKIFDDPITIYRGMLFGNVLLFAINMVITYYIARKHFHFNKLYSTVIAVVCSYNSINLFFKGFVYNELPLAFIMWLSLLLLLELIQSDGKKRVILSMLLGVVVAYSYLVHSRCLILFGTLAVVVVLYLCIYKKFIVQPIAFGSIFAVVYALEKILLQHVQTNLYLEGSDVVMPNSVEHMATGTWQYRVLTSFEGIGQLIQQFFSLAGTISIETGGMFTIISAITLYFVWKNFKTYKDGQGDKESFLLIIYSFVSFWGMVVCIALFGASNEKARFLLYSRYFAPFIGPYLLLGFSILQRNKDLKYKWIAIWSFVLNVLVLFTFVFYSLPRLNKTSMKDNASLYLFMPFARYESQTTFSKNVIFIALGLLLIFTIVLLFLYKKRQFVCFCLVTIIFSMMLVWQVEDKQNAPAAGRRYRASNATYELLNDKAFGNENAIYCIGDETYRKSVLVSCYDKDIHYNLSNIQITDDTILLANDVKHFEKYQPDYVYQLDKNEWIGIWDEYLSNSLSENYELEMNEEQSSN